jgi:NAD(P)-dependent dehydrogenase (short-subunit alcohol dehydrogenase family)
VLVTGAAQGLGLSIAEEFGAAGYRVVLADRNEAALQAAAAGMRERVGPDNVHVVAADVTEDASVDALVQSATSWAGGLDVLVNSAGVIARAPSDEVATDSWQSVLDVNLGGAFRCARAAFSRLRVSPYPSILNIGSLGSVLGMPMRLPYNASKTGLLGLTRTLAAEWGQFGIRVNAITPGFIDTAMMRSGLDSGALDEQLMLHRIPMRRLGQASEISGVALFLASPAASYINGATIPIDGGTTIDGTFF